MSSRFCNLYLQIICQLKENDYLYTDKMVASKKQIVSIIKERIMIIDRSEYIEQLLAKRWNGKVKIVTGIRRSGKSFLLSTLFKNRLIEDGARKEDFI